MKKFKFRLEPIQRIKAHQEKERQKEHAVAVHRVQAQKEHLHRLEAGRLQVMEHQRQIQGGSLQPAQMLWYSRYYLKLKRDALAGAEILRGLESEAEKKRQRLVEASRERKTYDKLKERQQAKFNQGVEQTINKQNDEISANNFRIRRASNPSSG
ncbi:MAG: flagellar export protein FliJ [candidate division Zixibacteria bacterium]|nr:flagellar export protein FliJ [candidate division Zixibacteria bacterium]